MTELNMPYYVYILSNPTRTIYTGVTNDLAGRVLQHKSKQIEGFTKRYSVTALVNYEEFDSPLEAIAREKQIKSFRRSKKTSLIDSINPQWTDLAQDW
jgi:putative endonuclease